jgi:hypothetical protein
MAPALSHPQEVVEVTVNVLYAKPFVGPGLPGLGVLADDPAKSNWAAFCIPAESFDCCLLCAP